MARMKQAAETDTPRGQALAERSLFVVGQFPEETAHRIEEASSAVGVPVAIIGRCEGIAEAIADAQPLAFIVQMEAAGAEQACLHVRSQPRLAQVPIFGAAAELNDLAFTELFLWGGDDLVKVSASHSIVRRLRALSSATLASLSPRPGADGTASTVQLKAATPQPQAIVAGPMPRWRSLMGRALYNGGFAVRFATTSENLVEECLANDVRVVVAADDLEPSGAAAALASARARGSLSPWVLVAPPKRMSETNATAKSFGPASAMDGFAPPENVLFVVNELLAARGVDKRASPRLLYGTAVAFRVAGRDEDEIGFSYNVSAGGAYVRTLAPPDPRQEVWLEMWAPRSERRVRLAGTVMWKRLFGPVAGSTVPSGFGVRFTDGLAGDLERWRVGCGTFGDQLLPLRSSPPTDGV
jgi:Tfp pilus assembly protein PilZ